MNSKFEYLKWKEKVKRKKNLRNMLGKFIKKPIKVIIYSIRQKISLCALDLLTLCCICLGGCCFGLKTRVIIKISKNPCYPINLDLFSWEWSKKFFFFLKKKIQNGRLKKTEFFNYPQKLSNCCQNFTDWSLG